MYSFVGVRLTDTHPPNPQWASPANPIPHNEHKQHHIFLNFYPVNMSSLYLETPLSGVPFCTYFYKIFIKINNLLNYAPLLVIAVLYPSPLFFICIRKKIFYKKFWKVL